VAAVASRPMPRARLFTTQGLTPASRRGTAMYTAAACCAHRQAGFGLVQPQ
jgi:hypothetical protein